MKKLFILFLISVSTGLWAVQAEEEPLFSAEDFANQSVIIVQDERTSQKCQAVRITPQWYLTAAHCVVPACDKTCEVMVHLLQGDLQAQAILLHSTAEPRVFPYYPKNRNQVRSDIALIRFNPKKEDYFFYDVKNKQQLDWDEFQAVLKRSEHRDARNQWELLAEARPVIYSITNSVSRQLLQPVMVPEVRPDGLYFQMRGGNGFYYFTELRAYMGHNFGVKKGQSGSGVVFPGGAIVGVVSSSLNTDGHIVLYDGENNPVGEIPYASDYFLFTPINRDNEAFINATIKSVANSGVLPRIVPINTSYARQTTAKVQDVFGEFSSGDEVLAVKVRD